MPSRQNADEVAHDVISLLGTLVDPDRIKIAAATMDRALTIEEVAAAVGLEEKAARRKLAGLIGANLVEISERAGHRRYRFRMRPLFEAMKAASYRPAEPDLEDDLDPTLGPKVGAFDRKVLGDFLADGRLKTIPAQAKKRDVILRYLAQRFEPERMYDEREVNAIIKPLHDDVASLRRYLVDEGYLTRQVIREVDVQVLMEGGEPSVEHKVMYWKPADDDKS